MGIQRGSRQGRIHDDSCANGTGQRAGRFARWARYEPQFEEDVAVRIRHRRRRDRSRHIGGGRGRRDRGRDIGGNRRRCRRWHTDLGGRRWRIRAVGNHIEGRIPTAFAEVSAFDGRDGHGAARIVGGNRKRVRARPEERCRRVVAIEPLAGQLTKAGREDPGDGRRIDEDLEADLLARGKRNGDSIGVRNVDQHKVEDLRCGLGTKGEHWPWILGQRSVNRPAPNRHGQETKQGQTPHGAAERGDHVNLQNDRQRSP